MTEESWNLERFNTDKFSDDGGSYTALVAQEVACPGPFPIVLHFPIFLKNARNPHAKVENRKSQFSIVPKNVFRN